MTWHTKAPNIILEELHSSEHGISLEEATRRLAETGPNVLPEPKAEHLSAIFFRQFKSPLIAVLLAASAAVFALGEIPDGVIILAVLLFNAIVGSIQEGRAQNTLRALRTFVATRATVLRDGREIIISDIAVVPGDILMLQEGEKVPADARVLLARNVRLDESTLTGESEPTYKTPDVIADAEAQTADQHNMLFKGTHVVAGNVRAIVVATGSATIIGTIAREIAAIDTEIPLKASIRQLSRTIIAAAGAISALLFALGIASGETPRTMFAAVVSLAVSIIPEGLPIVITLVLATGVWRMSKRSALVKRLQAVEALGVASVLAVDKTGTITKNEMIVDRVYVDGKIFEIDGAGYEPKGEVRLAGDVVDPANHPELLLAGRIAAFCAYARLTFAEDEKRWRVAGDPTEAALLVFGQKIGFHKDDLEEESPLADELPFEYKLKYHATAHDVDGERFITVVGAPEVVLEHAEHIWEAGKTHVLTEKKRTDLNAVVARLSSEGDRVLAFAMLPKGPNTLTPETIRALTFVGYFGMKDGLRPEARGAIARASAAGIRVVMITGDHEITARAIAAEAGIYREGDEVLAGRAIDALSDVALSEAISTVSVFARVTPEHKLRIIGAYKALDITVAMTGDGVNDAPALVAADLGVAMGMSGTAVAKEAADIVLLDDNIESIVAAVEEGRSIYSTIKKVILYLFSTSAGEVLTIAAALLIGYPLPILPAQIIWLNFVTDGFLDVALAMEPKEKGLLGGAFRHEGKRLVDWFMARRIALMALTMMIGTLLIFKERIGVDMAKAWTISLTTLAVFQWFNAWNCRSQDKSVFQMNPFSNLFLVGATLIVISLQLLAVYNPILQRILHTVPLTMHEWLTIIPVAASIIVVDELRKFFHKKI